MQDIVNVSIDPRLDIKQGSDLTSTPFQCVIEGGQMYQQNPLVSNSYSNSQVSYQLYSTGFKTAISKKLMQTQTWLFTIQGAGSFQNLFDGPKANPLNNATKSYNIQVNNSGISITPYQYLAPHMEYNNNFSQRNKQLCYSPCMPPAYQEASDWQNPLTGGSARSPLSTYGSCVTDITNASFPWIDPTLPSSDPNYGKKNRQYSFTEGIFCSPFDFASDDEVALCNINTIAIQQSFVPDVANKMYMSCAVNHPDPYTVLTATLVGAPVMYYTSITLRDSQVAKVPESLTYPYVKYDLYPKDNIAVLAGAQVIAISDAIRVDAVPNRVLVYFQNNADYSTFLQSNTYGRIDNLNVSFNNTQNLLTNALPQQLIASDIDNGYIRSYIEASQYVGTVHCIQFGKDIGLSDGLAPNTNAYGTLQVKALLTNISSVNKNFSFHVLVETQGTAVIT